MKTRPFEVTCVLSGKTFQMGDGVYEGTFVPRYQMNVYQPCYLGNHDGYASHYDENILEHLKEKGLPVPERNAKGYLPRD